MAMQQLDLLLGGIRDTSGNPLVGGKVYSYLAGTSTPIALYQDSSGSVAHANPLILDAVGRKLAYGDNAYKLEIRSASDAVLYTYDNIYVSRVTSQTSQWPDIFGGTASGSSNAYSITVPLSFAAYASGQQFSFIANHTITGASTLNVNGKGAVPIVWGATPSATAANVIRSGDVVSVIYDASSGGRFRIQSQQVGNFQDGSVLWGGTSGGTANAHTITLAPAILALTPGLTVKYKVNTTNNAAVTLNVNGLGAVEIRKLNRLALTNNEVSAGDIAELVYDGTYWILLSQRNVQRIGSFYATAIGGTIAGTMAASPGSNAVLWPVAFNALYMTANFPNVITSGSFLYSLNKAGSSTGQAGSASSGSTQITGLGLVTYNPGDVITISWSSTSLVGPSSAQVDLYGY